MPLTMDRGDIQTRVLLAVSAISGRDPVTPAMLIEDLGIDSLEYLELLIRVDDACGSDIRPDDAAKVKTIADLIEIARNSPGEL